MEFDVEASIGKLVKILRDEDARASDAKEYAYLRQFRADLMYGPRHNDGSLRKDSSLSARTLVDALYYICNDHPAIVGRGDHQIVIDLGTGAVAKTRARSLDYFGPPAEGAAPEPDTHLVIGHGKVLPGHGLLEESTRALTALGYAVWPHVALTSSARYPEPASFQFQARTDVRLPAVFSLAADLAEGGRYKTRNADDASLASAVNGAHLKTKLELSVASILAGNEEHTHLSDHCVTDLWTEKRPLHYNLVTFGHDNHGTGDEAVRHLFLVRIDRATNVGELVLGDLDHLALQPFAVRNKRTGEYI